MNRLGDGKTCIWRGVPDRGDIFHLNITFHYLEQSSSITIPSIRLWCFPLQWCGSGSLIGLVKKTAPAPDQIPKILKPFFPYKSICSKKWLIILCMSDMSLLFLCVKQKCIFFFLNMIFWWFPSIFMRVFYDFYWFFCYQDPDPHHWYGSKPRSSSK